MNGIRVMSDVALVSALHLAKHKGADATAEAVRKEMGRRCGEQEILDRYRRFALPYAALAPVEQLPGGGVLA